MALIRISGAVEGAPDYLKSGNKQGNEFTRDELDERIILFGDLDVTAKVIEMVPGTGDRYLHITLGVKERDLVVENFRQIGQELKHFVLAAYLADEMDFYCELQLPRIKHIVSKSTGEWHERLGHLHILVPLVNLKNGKKENPLGKVDLNRKFIDAFQEYINYKYGLASPKDNARFEVSKADIIDRTKESGKEFKKGAFKAVKADLKEQLREKIGMAEIHDYASFQEYLKGMGGLKIRNKGKPTEHLSFRPKDGQEFINLRDDEFKRDFFDLPEVERATRLGMANNDVVKSRMFEKREPEYYAELLKEWTEFRAKAIRYINPGSKKKALAYKEATWEQKAQILADLERRAQAGKQEKQKDERNRHGRDDAGDRREPAARDNEHELGGIGAGRQPNLAPAGKEPPPAAIGYLRSMSEWDVAGKSQGSEMLLPGDVRDELVVIGSDHVRAGLRRADNQVSQATGRTSDSELGQLSRDVKEAAAQREGNAEPTIQAIKAGLDAHRLLADLSVTHRLLPSDYVVLQAQEGSARIAHKDKPKNHFTVSDFLTMHMHMGWMEAQLYLASAYDRQQKGVPEPTVASPARPDMYAAFMADFRANESKIEAATKREIAELKSERWQEIRAANNEFKKEKAKIKADPLLTRAEIRTDMSRLEMAKADADKARKEQHEREDAEAERLRTRAERYRAWLQRKAQSGDLEALAEMRAKRIEPHRMPSESDRVISAVDGKQPGAAALLDQTGPGLKPLQYIIAHNGDITYSRAGRELLVDAGRKVYMIDVSDQTVEQGLRLAAIKWGGKMQLIGSDEFIVQAVTVAANKGMNIEFAAPWQRAMLQDMKHKIAIGKLALENHEAREKQRLKDEAEEARKHDKAIPTPGTTPMPGKQEKDKNKKGTGTGGTGGNAGGTSPPTKERPGNPASWHQVVHPLEPDNEQDEGNREK